MNNDLVLYQIQFYYKDGCNSYSSYIKEDVYISLEVANKYKKEYEKHGNICEVVFANLITE